MKIAYLITAHNNYEHLKKMIHALNDENVSFFIHIDKKSALPKNLSEYSNVTLIPNRVKVFWAGFSQVQATLNLLDYSNKNDDFDYFVFLSGVDYPIRKNDFLYQKLNKGGEYLEIMEGFQKHKSISRFKYYYFDLFDRKNHKPFLNKLIFKFEYYLKKAGFKKNIPYKIYVGANWFALSNACINYILEYVKQNKNYVKFFKTCLYADESFFHTIIGNSPYRRNIKHYLTYADWSSSPAPAIIKESHVELFKSEFFFVSAGGQYEPFFARKFNDNSYRVVDLINKHLRA